MTEKQHGCSEVYVCDS